MSLTFITDNFSWQEFACHDGTDVPADLQPNTRRLCEAVLEPLRAKWGAPIIIVSGYRTETYNAGVGGAMFSQHVEGAAADIRPVSLRDLPRLRAMVEQMLAAGELPAVGGYGHYPSWLHLDVRDRGPDNHLAQWSGNKVGSERIT